MFFFVTATDFEAYRTVSKGLTNPNQAKSKHYKHFDDGWCSFKIMQPTTAMHVTKVRWLKNKLKYYLKF